MSNKLLVTGGCGFIGSNFIRYWLNSHTDDQIVNFDSLTYAGHIESTKDFQINPNYTFVKGHICDYKAVDDVIKDIDIVVHFAAETHVDRSVLDPSVFVKTNVEGTQILLDFAKKNNVKRFHHISTDEVFGSLLEGDTNAKFNENTPYDPRSPYSASKAASDHLVRAYFHTYGLPITITNCSNNFGSYQDPEKFIPRMITDLIDNKDIRIYGDGLNIRDWLYVDDHARAIEKVIMTGKIGESYLVGGLTKERTNLDIARALLKIFKRDESSIKFVKDRLGHDRKYSVDLSKIKSKLGWEPKYSFEDGLRKTIEWYKNNEWWWRPLKENAEKFYGEAEAHATK